MAEEDGTLSDQIIGARQEASPAAASDGSLSSYVLEGVDTGKLRVASQAAAGTDQATAARVLRASARTGLPEDQITDHLDEVEAMMKQSSFDPEKFRKNSPLFAKWLSESPNRIAVLGPDTQGLQDLEQIYRLRTDTTRPFLDSEIVKRAEQAAQVRAQVASKNSRYEPDLSSGQLVDLGAETPAAEFYPKFLQEELDTRRAENEFIKNPKPVGAVEAVSEKFRTNPVFLAPLYNQIPGLVNAWDLERAADRIKADQGTAADFDLVDRAGRMEYAAQRRGMSAGGHLGEFAASTPAFLGDLAFAGGAGEIAGVSAKVAVSGLARGLVRKGVGFAADLGTTAAIAEGVKTIAGTIRRQTPAGEASIDDAGNFHYQITSDKGEPLMLSFGKEALSTLLDIAGTKVPISPFFKALSGEVGETAAKGIVGRVMRMGTEGATEALSGLTINETTKLAKAVTMVGPAYQLPSLAEVVGTGAGFALMGAAHGARAQTADASARTIEGQRGIVDSLGATKAEPELVEQAIAAQTKDTAEEHVYAPIEDIKSFFQSKGLDPRAEMTKVLGSPEKYDQAVQGNHDLQIPTSRYAMTLDRDPEASKYFQDRIKFDPLDSSRADVDAAMAAAKERAAGRKASGELTLPAELAQSPEGLQGSAFNDLNDRQQRAAAAFMESLQPGRYELARPDGTKVTADLMKVGGKNVLVGENGEELGAGAFMPQQYRDNAGAARYEPGYKIRRLGKAAEPSALDPQATAAQTEESGLRVGRAVESRMRELGFTREAESFGRVYAERYKARAERRGLGEDPLDLFDKLALRIMRREGPGGEAPEGAGNYVRVHEQGAQPHIERVAGDTPAEVVQNASHEFPDATIEPMTPEEVKSLLENAMGGGTREYLQGGKAARTFNQPDNPAEPSPVDGEPAPGDRPPTPPERRGPPRGSSEFGPDGVDINLFRTADRSTFMHESGHVWLHELIEDGTTPGVREQLPQDLDQVLEKLGADVRSKDGMKKILDALTVDQHEQWATWIEKYLMDGKAPSPQLRGVFYRFGQWLTRIYKNWRGLEQQSGKQLDMAPEVRSVLDRLLATDEQIDQAKETEGLQAVLSGADWLPAKEREGLAQAFGEVDRASKEELQQKLMADVRKEESAQWEREREGVRQDVAHEVDQAPEQRALANLARGRQPDGSELGPDDPPAMKISREEAVRLYGKDALKGLPRSIFTSDGGLHPDDVAQAFGMSSGDELLQRIRATKEPMTPEEQAARTRLEGLEAQRALLLESKQPLQAEQEEAQKNLKKGRKTLANRLEAAMRAEEKSKLDPILALVQEIHDRGGIDPSSPTEDLPRSFRSKKAGAGASSDVIAQELYDRGLLESPESDALYQKLGEWKSQIDLSKERAAEIPKEARRLARERVSESIEALVKNAAEQEQLRVQLDRLSKEAQAFRKEHAVNQREALIDRLTDQQMREKFPDLLTDGRLPEEASRAVYNAKRSQLAERQIELLAQYKMPSLRKVLEIMARRGGFSEVLRAQAEERIHGMEIRELNPGVFQRGARDAVAAQARALGKGDFQGVFNGLRDEILNNELYRAAQSVKDEAGKIATFMGRFNKTSVRKGIAKGSPEALDQLDQLVERFDFRKAVTNQTLKARQSLRDWAAERERLASNGEGYAAEIPPRLLDVAFRKSWKEMTFEELDDVYTAAQNIEHQALAENRLLAAVGDKNFQDRVDGAAQSIVSNSRGPIKVSLEPRRPGLESKIRSVAGYFASLRKMASLAREMDGFKDGGAMWDLFIRPANHAATRESTMQAEAAEKFQELLKQYSPADQLRMSKVEFIPEIGNSLSRWGQIMVALNSGNEGNLQRVKDGERWNDAQIRAIHDRLTEKDWAFVQGVAKLIDSYWPQIRDLNRRVTGLVPEKVEPKPFMTKFGEMPGWYFPIKYDDIRSPRAAENVDREEAKPTLMGAVLRATTSHGHREARLEHVEQPLRLDPGVISMHINQVVHDLSHYEFVTDSSRLLADDQLRRTISEHYGDQPYREMKAWIRDIAVGQAPATSAVEKTFNWIRQGSTTAQLGWNALNAMLDQTALLPAMKRVGIGPVVRGVGMMLGDAAHMENSVRKVEEMSEFMANRGRTRLREINEAVGQLTQKSTPSLIADMGLGAVTGGRVDTTDIAHSFYWLMAQSYKIQEVPVWMGAYEKAMAEQPVGSERSAEDREAAHLRAVDLADQSVIDSFGSGQVKDLSRAQRGGPAMKLFTTFYAYANTTLQQNIESWQRFRKDGGVRSGPLSYGRLAADLALVNVAPVMLASLAGMLLLGDKRDDKKRLRDLVTDQGAYLMGQDPILRELAGALHGRDYQGPAGARLLAVTDKLIGNVAKEAEGGTQKMDWRDLNQVSGHLFHYPATAIQRLVDGVGQIQRGSGDARQLLFGRPKKR